MLALGVILALLVQYTGDDPVRSAEEISLDARGFTNLVEVGKVGENKIYEVSLEGSSCRFRLEMRGGTAGPTYDGIEDINASQLRALDPGKYPLLKPCFQGVKPQ